MTSEIKVGSRVTVSDVYLQRCALLARGGNDEEVFLETHTRGALYDVVNIWWAWECPEVEIRDSQGRVYSVSQKYLELYSPPVEQISKVEMKILTAPEPPVPDDDDLVPTSDVDAALTAEGLSPENRVTALVQNGSTSRNNVLRTVAAHAGLQLYSTGLRFIMSTMARLSPDVGTPYIDYVDALCKALRVGSVAGLRELRGYTEGAFTTKIVTDRGVVLPVTTLGLLPDVIVHDKAAYIAFNTHSGFQRVSKPYLGYIISYLDSLKMHHALQGKLEAHSLVYLYKGCEDNTCLCGWEVCSGDASGLQFAIDVLNHVRRVIE